MADEPNYLAIIINQSKATAIAIDKTKTQGATIVDPFVRSNGGLVRPRNEIQPKMCRIPKLMNPSKKINHKNAGMYPILQPRKQLLNIFANGNEQRPSNQVQSQCKQSPSSTHQYCDDDQKVSATDCKQRIEPTRIYDTWSVV